MIWNQILGVDEQRQLFQQAARRGRLSHSYLFIGPEGNGKKRFAKVLAQCLLCEQCNDDQLDACGVCSACKMMQAGSHPDFFQVLLPEGKRVLPIKLITGTKEQRGRAGLCYELSLKPIAGHRKVALIDDADMMNQESANALLKTLEEPPPHSYLFLIASHTDALLPTIRSRCQQIRFHLLPDEIITQLVLQQDIASNANEAAEMARLANGSVQLARQLADPELRNLKNVLYAQIVLHPFNSLMTSQLVKEALDEIAKSGPRQRQAAIWAVRYLAQFFHQIIRAVVSPAEDTTLPGARRFIQQLEWTLNEVETSMQLFDRTTRAEQQLERFMSVPLCLDGLFDELGRIMRGRNAFVSR